MTTERSTIGDVPRFTGQNRVPRRACVFHCPEGAVQFAAGENKEGRFSILAYDGGITKHWYWGNFAIDLEGLSFAARRLPVLDSHWTDRRLGFTTSQERQPEVTFEGQFLENQVATELRQDMLKGFPMQASLYPVPRRIEQVEEGTSAAVNGRTLKGPGAIFREAVVQEVSMCVFGALSPTRATAFADHDNEILEFTLTRKDNPMTKEAETPALTAETLKTHHAQVHQAVFESGQAAGAQLEQTRFAQLQDAAGGDRELLVTAFTGGWDVSRTLREANSRLAAQLTAAREQRPPAPAAVPNPIDRATQEFKTMPAPGSEEPAFDEKLATETQLREHFAATPSVRDEFVNVESYLAYVRHEVQNR